MKKKIFHAFVISFLSMYFFFSFCNAEEAEASLLPAAKKKPLTLERLYSFPKLEGTAPTQPYWSADSQKLAFLWNNEGMPFRDLWMYYVKTGQLQRLTSLPHEMDDWTEPPSHRDRRLKKYLPPDGGLQSFEWAPDSRHLVFSFRRELYIADITSKNPTRRLTRTKESESNPQFSPDSKRIAFVSGGELHVFDLVNGTTLQLTDGGGLDIKERGPSKPGTAPGTYKWAPDGKWICFQHNDESGIEGRLVVNFSGERVSSRKQSWRIAREGNSKTRLGIIPAAGGKTVWLTDLCDDYYIDWEWSPDSKRLALKRVEENQKNSHIEIIDVLKPIEKNDKKKLDQEEGEDRSKSGKQPSWVRILYSETDDRWIGSLCNFVSWSCDGRLILFPSESDGWNHLYLIRADGSEEKPRQLTRGEWEVTDYRLPAELSPKFSVDGQRIFFTANRSDHSERHLYSVKIDSGEIRQLTNRKGVNVSVVSPDNKKIGCLVSTFADPWDLYLKDSSGGSEDTVRVTYSPLQEFDDYDWPQPRIIEFPSRDGKKLRALIFTPPEITDSQLGELESHEAGEKKLPASKRFPVIDFVHGAGYAQAVLNRWGGYSSPRFQFNQFASQNGYVVIDVDFRGSSGYGHEWGTDVYLHLGGKDLQDELAAVDFLKRLSWVDTDRIGVWGISYGGFMTLMLMFNAPDTFKAGSAWAAVTDWENYNRRYTQQRLRTPEEHPEAYQRSSPIYHVKGLKGHLQLQHGMMDANVHFQDIVQLTDALVYAGISFTQVFYPQSDHGWARPEVWIHSTRSMFKFFEHNVKGK